MSVFQLTAIMFINNIIFIGFRTINIKAIAEKNINMALFSGAIIHWSWLISIAIGATSMYEIINDFKFEYIPIVMASTIGGLIGTYIGLYKK